MKKKHRQIQQAVMLGILVVLILFSGVQAYEVQIIKKDIGEVQLASVPEASASSTDRVVKSLNDLPEMVGGC